MNSSKSIPLPYNIPTDPQIAEKAVNLITADLGRPYSIATLASECGVTPYTLKRIFYSVNGQSIATFSLTARIEYAKVLLVSTNNTLQMIADAVGYTEGNNFQISFKRVVGMTPGEWRRSNKG